MRTLTLLIRVYNGGQLGIISKLLKSDVEGLRVDLQAHAPSLPGWVQVAVSGEDETTATNYLTHEFGQCAERLESLERFSSVRGRMMALDTIMDGIVVDIGVFTPPVGAKVSLFRLQSQLADGRKVGLKKLAEVFGFCEGFPLTVKVMNVTAEESRVEGMLAEEQVSLYKTWTRCFLDRLIIIGTSAHEVRSALMKAECSRDVADLEPLGLLECTVLCKLGTDAVGLIPKVGKQLRSAVFTVFSPRKILGFFGEDSSFLVS
jgi:hypothetical protein